MTEVNPWMLALFLAGPLVGAPLGVAAAVYIERWMFRRRNR